MSRRRMLNVETESENLHDTSTDIADTYINAANGAELPYTGWSSTDKIKVTVGDYIIKYSSDTSLQISSVFNCAYKTAGGVLRFTYALSKITDTILHIPEGVEYIRLSDTTANLKRVEIYKVKA